MPLDAATLKQLQGTWVVTYPKEFPRVYTVAASGDVTWQQNGKQDLLVLEGEEIILTLSGLERWRLANGQLRIDCFNPVTRYPKGPFETARGVKKTDEEVAEDTAVLRTYEGKWSIRFPKWTYPYLEVDFQGSVKEDNKKMGNLVRLKGQVFYQPFDFALQRWTLDGKQLQVEYFDRISKFLNNPAHPQECGIGVRLP